MKTEYARLCATAKSRAALVARCRALATELDLDFESKPSALMPRAVDWALRRDPYRVFGSFDGASRVGAFIGHWHIELGSDATFPACFANVNPYHRQKATTCVDRFDDLLDCVRRSFEALGAASKP